MEKRKKSGVRRVLDTVLSSPLWGAKETAGGDDGHCLGQSHKASRRGIYFYEWSDLETPPLEFETAYDLKAFLDKSGLYYGGVKLGKIMSGEDIHVMCYPHMQSVAICESKDALRKELDYYYEGCAYTEMLRKEAEEGK
jgi:hypothetical protein